MMSTQGPMSFKTALFYFITGIGASAGSLSASLICKGRPENVGYTIFFCSIMVAALFVVRSRLLKKQEALKPAATKASTHEAKETAKVLTH